MRFICPKPRPSTLRDSGLVNIAHRGFSNGLSISYTMILGSWILLTVFASMLLAQDPVCETNAVPVPPDTFQWEADRWPDEAEGYVPNTIAQAAPEPPALLRPRYRNHAQAGKNTEQTPKQAPKRAASQKTPTARPIRQVSAIEESPQKTTQESVQKPTLEQRSVHDSGGHEKSRNRFAADTFTENNTHSCNELTCGSGGCGRSFLNATEGLFCDGWINVGSFMNTSWPDGRNNTPLYYNDRNGEAVMNQLYLSLGRNVNTRKNRWDFGGRLDILYGTDFFYTQSLGLETRNRDLLGNATLDPLAAAQRWNSNAGHRRSGTASLYGLSLPQAYAEVFVPYGNGVTLKVGHFYADMGLESVMAPQNFFYSHSYSFMHGMPTTLTGATATMKLGRRLSAVAGFTSGWNIFDSPTGNNSGLLGLKWRSYDQNRFLSFMVHSGEDTLRGSDQRTNYVLTYHRNVNARLQVALEHTLGYEEDGTLDWSTGRRNPARWLSLAPYLQYQWSNQLAFGLRAEWFRDDGHSRIQKSPVSTPYWKLSGQDYYEVTFGVHWKPTRFLTIRPEIRYDWSDVKVNGQGGAYSNGTKSDMLSVAIDGVIRF